MGTPGCGDGSGAQAAQALTQFPVRQEDERIVKEGLDG